MEAKEASEGKVTDLEPGLEEPEKQQPGREESGESGAGDEFGRPVSLRKLCSLASAGEMLVLLLGTLAALAQGSSLPAIATMIGEFVDLFWSTGSVVALPEITALALKFVAIGGGLVVVSSLQGFAFPWFAEQQVKKMRPAYLDAVLHRDIAWFDVHDVPSLIFGMNSDLEVYVDAFGEKLGQSFMSMGTILLGFAVGIHYSWQVGLLMIAAVLLMGMAGSVVGQAIMEQVTETQGSYAAASKLVAEVLHAIRTVVAFGGERRELARYEASVEEARRRAVRSRAKAGAGSGLLFGTFIAAMGAACLASAQLLYDGRDTTVGRLCSAMFSCLTAGFSLGQLPPGFAGLQNARAAMRRFFSLRERESEIQASGRSGEALGPIESLRLEGVHFAYPARPGLPILNGLTLDVKKGQKVGVVGESGSGKSTVIALLERFYDPLQGRVLVNGTDLKLCSVKSLRAQIGYVGQEPVLFATSIRENIRQGRSGATDEDVKRAAKHARLDFVKKLPAKFESFVGCGGSQFSGGQKQRIAIARALVKRPSMLLLDEATSALDGTSEKQIQDTIDKIGSASELGMTIVAVAHRLCTVKNSDVIYVLRGGRVAEQGSHGELLAKDGGIYRALAAAQHLEGEEARGEAEAEEEAEAPERRLSLTSLGSWGSLREELAAKEEEEGAGGSERAPKGYRVPMRRLLAFCRQERCFFVPGVMAALVSGCTLPLSAAYCLADSTIVLSNPDMEAMMRDIKVTALWALGLACARAAGDAITVTCFGVLSEALCKRCRVAMLTAIFRQEVGFHDDPQNSPARLADALQKWALRIQNFLTLVMGQVSALAAFLGGAIVAFANSWEMAAAMLAFLPLTALASSLQIQVQMGGKSKDSLKLRAAQEVLSEALMGVRTVQASNCEEDILALYCQELEQGSFPKELLRFLSSGLAFGVANGIIFWNYAVGFWLLGFFWVEGRTDYISGFRAFLGVLFAGHGVSTAFGLLGDMGKARAAARDVFRLLDRQTAVNGLEPDGRVPAGALRVGRLEFEAVGFSYPFRAGVQVLRGLSCVVEAGQSVGVVGPSGGGKSTMLSMIQRFYDPQSGGVYVGEERLPLKSLDIRWWRKQVGFVGQEPVLFDTSVIENLTYGLEPGEDVPAEWLARCKEMADLTFLDDETQVGLRGSRLSGGQKQRVAICRALLRNPPVLLLDEATSALDSKSEEVVQAALERAKKGRTSFAIAHRLSTVRDCDVILVVADGRVAEQGSHSELLARRGVYYDLQAQQERRRSQ